MRISVFWVVSCLAATGIAAAPVQAQSELVIDDFTNSPYKAVFVNHPSFLTEYQTGATIVGGVRQTSLTVSSAVPSFGQPTRLQIRPNGAMVISAGYKSYFGLVLGYGYDATGGISGLNLNLSGGGGECLGCDRFRINFDGSDSELGYLMQVHDRDGNIATLNASESVAGRLEPFHVDFAFADFEQDSAHPVDWNHIDFVFVLFQTGNLLGGHDFAVTKISAIPPPPPEGVD